MNIIRHRRNTRAELEQTPRQYGIELDIRSPGDALSLHHDAVVPGERLVDWLESFQHGTLILNVKEEGLEDRVLRLMKERDIEDFFFLDQSFPFLIKTARTGESRCAVRISEFESIETCLSLAGMVDWVWVDCFTKFPLTSTDARRLAEAGFKLCLVSPELQGRMAPEEITAMSALLAERGITADAVCTKTPELWG